MGNLNFCSGGCFVWKTRRDTPQNPRTLTTSWVKRVHCWPRNRVHPINDSVEELSEDELSTSNLEEEALPTGVVKETTNKNVPQEDLVEELPQGGEEEEPLSILKAHGVVYEHDFTEDLTVNPACDRIEETPCNSKVAFSICETDCFLESFSSSDTDDNADSPHDSCPQTPEKCMEYNKDSETEISENSLLVYWRNVLGDIKDNKED
ncbi:hypothetical protein R6Z07F_011404 [Ovis aries]